MTIFQVTIVQSLYRKQRDIKRGNTELYFLSVNWTLVAFYYMQQVSA